MVKNAPANAGDAGDVGSIPGLGRFPGVGNGNPFQCSCLENSMAEEPGGLQSMLSQRVGHDLATENILDSQTPVQTPLPVSVNKVLFECSHAHSFSGRAENI